MKKRASLKKGNKDDEKVYQNTNQDIKDDMSSNVEIVTLKRRQSHIYNATEFPFYPNSNFPPRFSDHHAALTNREHSNTLTDGSITSSSKFRRLEHNVFDESLVDHTNNRTGSYLPLQQAHFDPQQSFVDGSNISSSISRRLEHAFDESSLGNNNSRTGSYIPLQQAHFDPQQSNPFENISDPNSALPLNVFPDRYASSQSSELRQNEEQNSHFTRQQALQGVQFPRRNIDYLVEQNRFFEDSNRLHNNASNIRGDPSSAAMLRNEVNNDDTTREQYLFSSEANHGNNGLMHTGLSGTPNGNHENRLGNHFPSIPRNHLSSFQPDFFPLPPTSNHSDMNMLRNQQERIDHVQRNPRSLGVLGLPAHFRDRRIISLGTTDDEIWLSPFLCFLRSHCIEVFDAKAVDVTYRRSAKTKVEINQVGIRCRFCAHKPYQSRGKRSSSFPSSMSRIYQSVTMMIREHFHNCAEFPPEVRKSYLALKGETTRGELESKRYWVQSAKKLGMRDTEEGIFTNETVPR